MTIDESRYLLGLLFQIHDSIKQDLESPLIFISRYFKENNEFFMGAEISANSSPKIYCLNQDQITETIPDISVFSTKFSMSDCVLSNAEVTCHYEILQAPQVSRVKEIDYRV